MISWLDVRTKGKDCGEKKNHKNREEYMALLVDVRGDRLPR
jgi:hypothetical protein